jgi:hypothetical protein
MGLDGITSPQQMATHRRAAAKASHHITHHILFRGFKSPPFLTHSLRPISDQHHHDDETNKTNYSNNIKYCHPILQASLHVL